MRLQPLYEDPETLRSWLNSLLLLSRKESLDFDLPSHVYQLMQQFQDQETFNLSHLRSVSEQTVVSSLPVRRILPMVSFNGLLFVTHKTLYFQP